jgi:hypothetical protein
MPYGAGFRRNFALEDAIGSHTCSLEANMRVTNGISLGCSLLLPVGTVIYVQTLKDFKLENLVKVGAVPRCIDLIENVVRTGVLGPIHTFRMYRLLGRRERPRAEAIGFHAVKVCEETMLYMIASTLLQMLGLDHLVESYSDVESQIFTVGIPNRIRLTEAERFLLNYAFFDPQLRRSGKIADLMQLLATQSETNCTFDLSCSRVV